MKKLVDVAPFLYSVSTAIFAIAFFFPMLFTGDIYGYSTDGFTVLACIASVVVLGVLGAILLYGARASIRWLFVLFTIGIGFIVEPTVKHLLGDDFFHNILPTPIMFPCIGLGILMSVSVASFARR